MYGRADPKPLAPAYTSEDLKKMRAANEAEQNTKRALLSGGGHGGESAFAAIEVGHAKGAEAGGALGLDCGAYKWTQTQSHVEVFVLIPPFTHSKCVTVEMSPGNLRVAVKGEALLEGSLLKEINCKADGSTWFIRDARVLEISMLKRYRRGLAYARGRTNADTFWRSLFRGAPQEETLQVCARVFYTPSLSSFLSSFRSPHFRSMKIIFQKVAARNTQMTGKRHSH